MPARVHLVAPRVTGIAAAGMAHVLFARAHPADDMIRGRIPRDVRSRSVMRCLSTESGRGRFCESVTAPVSESCGADWKIHIRPTRALRRAFRESVTASVSESCSVPRHAGVDRASAARRCLVRALSSLPAIGIRDSLRHNKSRQSNPYQPPSLDDFPSFRPQPRDRRASPLVGVPAL